MATDGISPTDADTDPGEAVASWRYDPAADEFELSDGAAEVFDVYDDAPSQSQIVAQFAVEDQQRVRSAFERAVAEQSPITVTATLGDDADRQTARIHATPLVEDGTVVALSGIAEDRSTTETLKRRVEVLRDASQELMGAENETDVAQIIAGASKNILGYVNTTIRLEDDGVLRTTVATEECLEKAGERPDYDVDEETAASRVFRTGEPEIHQDHTATEDGHDRGELMSGLYVPIGDHGVMSAGDTTVAAFDQGDLEAAELLGELGSKALTRIVSERELKAQNDQLSEFIQDTTATIEEVTATTDTVRDLASEAVEKAEDGDEAIESVAEQLADIERKVEDAATEVQELNDVVAEIDEFVDLIDDIADQTNMLALNANIEAARAGEAGQGFAVVADEVKELAEHTQEATNEIETLIDNVEQQTNQATESILDTTSYAAEGRETADTSSELLDEIVAVARETEDGVAEISSAMDQQANSIESVAATLDRW